jgi:hypothetical protein
MKAIAKRDMKSRIDKIENKKKKESMTKKPPP